MTCLQIFSVVNVSMVTGFTDVVMVTEKLSFWGDRRDYWNYLSEGVGRMKTLETIVKRVQTLAHVSHMIMHLSHMIIM